MNFSATTYDSGLKITKIRKDVSELFTWVVLLDPADAILVHLFGFFGQHSVPEVGSVETHGKPENIDEWNFSAL